jgi:flagellar biosynthesis/type III secretory pathway chaperone
MTLFSTLRLVPVRAPLVLTIAIFLFGNMPLGDSQRLSAQPATLQEHDSTFHSISDKFSITVPDSWVIQDISNTETDTLLEEMMQGSRLLAQLCPLDQAIADIENTYNCEESNESIYIQQYPNLADEPEFASIASSNIRNEDLLDYHIMKLQKLGYTEINILHNANMTINVINSDTNKTITVVPANLVELRYNSANSTDTRGYFMLAVTNVTSNLGIISGYSLSYEDNATTLPSSILPPEPIVRIFQSFEFVKEAGEEELSAPSVESHDYDDDAFTSIGISSP